MIVFPRLVPTPYVLSLCCRLLDFIPEAVAEGVNGEAPVDNNVNTKTKYKQILGNRIVGLLAAYILVYVGVEVTIG